MPVPNLTLPTQFITNIINAIRNRTKLVVRARINPGYEMGIDSTTFVGPTSLSIEVTFVKGNYPVVIEFIGFHWKFGGDIEIKVEKVFVSSQAPIVCIPVNTKPLLNDGLVYIWIREVKGKRYYGNWEPDVSQWENDSKKSG